jgi:D-glycero-alpha-D-manno-heptose-7-phosphate kinase
MYDEARQHGALGGKITGAGGGGYLLLYCDYEKKHKVAEAVTRVGGQPTEFAFEFNGMQTWRINAHASSCGR